MNIALNNARILSGSRLERINIGIEGGKIAKMGHEPIQADRTVDCAGKIVLPGLIDEHVHFRVPGGEHKEDWATGTRAAARGGITRVIDMPNTNPAVTTAVLLDEKRRKAEKESKVRFGLHFGATRENTGEFHKVKGRAASIKVFMGSSTGDLLIDDEPSLRKVFEAAEKESMPVTLHAEDESVMQRNSEKHRETGSATVHNKIRSAEAEEKAIKTALRIQKGAGNKLHFLHVSTKRGLELIKDAKLAGRAVTCEVATHHLFLDESHLAKQENFAKMNPPLRSRNDAKALWKGVNDGTVDCIATDHTPHTIEEKTQSYEKAPAGVPGVETMAPLLLNAVNQKRMKLEKLVELCSSNPARIFRYKPNRIEEGAAADITVVDMEKRRAINNEELETKCGWSPYHGHSITGDIALTIVDGKIVYGGDGNERNGNE